MRAREIEFMEVQPPPHTLFIQRRHSLDSLAENRNNPILYSLSLTYSPKANLRSPLKIQIFRVRRLLCQLPIPWKERRANLYQELKLRQRLRGRQHATASSLRQLPVSPFFPTNPAHRPQQHYSDQTLETLASHHQPERICISEVDLRH